MKVSLKSNSPVVNIADFKNVIWIEPYSSSDPCISEYDLVAE